MSNQVENRKRIGQTIRELRGEYMTQTELAAAVSEAMDTTIHKSTISKIEAGQRALSFEEAIAIATVLAVPISDLANDLLDPGFFESIDLFRESFKRVDKSWENLQEELAKAYTVADRLGNWVERIKEENPNPAAPPNSPFKQLDDLESLALEAKELVQTIMESAEDMKYQTTSYGDLSPANSFAAKSLTKDGKEEYTHNLLQHYASQNVAE